MTRDKILDMRDEMYAPRFGKDKSPKRGKTSLEKLIAHYQSQGYTITSKGLPVPTFNEDSVAS